MTAPTDITGKKFGRLVALEDAGSNGRRRLWHFRCECGGTATRTIISVRASSYPSCGCHKPGYSNKGRSPASKTHGLSRLRIKRVWSNMRDRCTNPRNHRYADYGGRGIAVCPEWETLADFAAWAFANGYRDDLQIDRTDNDAGYSPQNCRFVTPAQNMANQKRSIHYMVKGERLGMRAIEERYGIRRATFRHRVEALGYSPEDALTASPPKGAAARKARDKEAVRDSRAKFLGVF